MQPRPKALIVILNFYKWDILQKSTKIDRLLANIFDWEIEALFKEFTVYILLLYKSLVLHAIKNQKFPKPYPPLSPKYVQYKKKMGMKKGFWQATGFSQVNLMYWKLKNHYAIGFKRNLIHPASGTKVYKIHNYVERGTSKMPPRPLYYPIAVSIRKHIYDTHFKRFMKDRHPEWLHLLD